MKNRKRTLSVLTALLLIGASNDYHIKHISTSYISATAVELDGERYYTVPYPYIFGFKDNMPVGIVHRLYEEKISSPLKNEDYLLPKNEFDFTLKKTPKFKGGK